jgi:hypothetical protein
MVCLATKQVIHVPDLTANYRLGLDLRHRGDTHCSSWCRNILSHSRLTDSIGKLAQIVRSQVSQPPLPQIPRDTDRRPTNNHRSRGESGPQKAELEDACFRPDGLADLHDFTHLYGELGPDIRSEIHFATDHGKHGIQCH